MKITAILTTFILAPVLANAGWLDFGKSPEKKEEAVQAVAPAQPSRPLTKQQVKYVCGCRGAITVIQRNMDEEKEIAKTSGVIDQGKMHDMGAKLVHANKYIKSVDGERVPASSCAALKFDELQSFAYCHDGIWKMNNP